MPVSSLVKQASVRISARHSLALHVVFIECVTCTAGRCTRRMLAVTRSQTVALILKDTHTVEHVPERLTRWVRIAREEIEKAGR